MQNRSASCALFAMVFWLGLHPLQSSAAAARKGLVERQARKASSVKQGLLVLPAPAATRATAARRDRLDLWGSGVR